VFTDPQIEERTAQHYAGIRVQVPVQEFQVIIPQLIDEVVSWLGAYDITPDGPPLMRFHVINMDGKMDVELGVRVATVVSGDDRISAGVIPAGRYATLIYTGVENGIASNAALIDWAMRQGLVWDRWDTPEGDAFGARVEFYLTEPEDEPDPAQWETEVAIRLAE